MSLRPRLSRALVVGAALLSSAAARAQTTSTTVSVTIKNNSDGVERGETYNPDYIYLNQFNQINCLGNELVQFNVGISAPASVRSSTHLEAWIGTACDQAANRATSANVCRKIGEVGNNVQTVLLWVRDMVGSVNGGGVDTGTGGTGGTGGMGGTGGLDVGGSGGTLGSAGTLSSLLGGTGGTAGTGGDIAVGGSPMLPFAETAGAAASLSSSTTELVGPPSVEGEQSIDVCEGGINTTPSDRTIYFVLLDGDGVSPTGVTGTTTAKWAFKYDMAGPSAPVSVHAGIGESSLVMGWSQADDAPIDLKQYIFLCDPPPGGAAAPVGMGGAGGEGDGETQPPPLLQGGGGCSTTAFTPGQIPSVEVITTYGCGNVQSTSTSGEAKPLVNGATYAVAMVSRDGYYNVGPVSNVTCGTPELVTDFYEAYRSAGGKGGGGFCAIARTPSHALTALMLLGSLGLFARRRARTRGERRSRS